MPSLEKEIMVKVINKRTEGKTVFFSTFEGLTVSEVEKLRSDVRQQSAKGFVVKKTLARKVFESEEAIKLDDLFGNHVFLTTSTEEPQKVSKALVDFAKGHSDKFQVKGVVMDGEVRDGVYVKRLSDLPTKEELLAKLLGSMNAPITNFVLNLNGLIKGLAVVLNEVKKQKEEKGEA